MVKNVGAYVVPDERVVIKKVLNFCLALCV